MLIPNPPLFIIDGQDLVIFHSMEDLVRYVEPADVPGQRYIICDSQGRRLFFDTIKPRGFLDGPEYVFLRAIDLEPSVAIELFSLLCESLGRQGYPRQELQSLPLSDLIQKLV
jgi:hypothetical protein